MYAIKTQKLKKNNRSNSVNIINTKMISETAFGGYPLDLLFGILYLKRKHPNLITLPFDIKQLLITYSNDLRDRTPFTFIGCLIFKCKDDIVNRENYKNNTNTTNSRKVYSYKPVDFIIEFPGKLTDSEFKQLITNAKQSGKRFTIIPLIFRWSCAYKFTGHANILIFDFENNVVERFEPYGYISAFSKEEQTVSDGFNKKFKQFMKSHIGMIFKDQTELLKKGPQYIEENQLEGSKSFIQKSDPEGFCGAWSLWYADLKLSNPDKTSHELLTKALFVIQKGKRNKLRAFIRNYSTYLVKERYQFLKKIKQKNPYNYHMKEQLLSLEQKKSTIDGLLKTTKILESSFTIR